jgi:hypothetical protein
VIAALANPDARVAEQAFEEGLELTEAEVNDRLEAFHPDVATLRRYLVDEGLLQRTPSGTKYARA